MDRRVEFGKTSNVLEFSFDEGKILLNVTDAMLENCAHCQLYVEDLNEGMRQKLLCMLRENSAKPSTSAKHDSALPKKTGHRQAAKKSISLVIPAEK
ncbi:hypothetical protein DAPPUDRAFT_323423 [Daphnia pulex]|uniref:Uncharacterized protein n=1 Tax=Daphnia pulex TaxID=6669 RepID=E9GYU2_DAPPU|nr:hypothetical protein DAPPUDRAFT_323423 [Daphnia pulex]|eukprot:EFX75350.1 hypothetical protein DAPPUDRAFT_323423 [Daphnia pulex]